MKRKADINYQIRGLEFNVGDYVFPVEKGEDYMGKVLAVYPSIGMVDVLFPQGAQRVVVEDLQQANLKNTKIDPPEVLAEAGMLEVEGETLTRKEASERVARAFVHQALYWAARNRKYRATQEEKDCGKFFCPKCPADDEGVRPYLRGAVYKRREDRSERLLGCPGCMFLIKRGDFLGEND